MWTLRVCPSSRKDLFDKVGQSATEDVSGTYDAESKVLKLQGTGTSDETLLSNDTYNIKVSKEETTFSGTTKGSGRWEGRISARLTKGSLREAPKEYPKDVPKEVPKEH